MATNGAIQRIALYPGSFDGLTYGHLDLIERGRKLFDRLYVGVASNSRKSPTFTTEERMLLLKECTEQWPNVEVLSLSGLTVDVADKLGAQFILRGLRAVSDFEFELQLGIMNHQLKPHIESIFLVPAPEYIFLSSSMVKEVCALGGDITHFVPPPVQKALNAKFHGA